MYLTQEALPGDEADDIPGQAKSPQPPIIGEDSAGYPDKLVSGKIQDSELGQCRQILHL